MRPRQISLFVLFVSVALFVILIVSRFTYPDADIVQYYRDRTLYYRYLVLAILLMPVNWWLEYLKFVQMSHLDQVNGRVVLIKSLLSGIFLSAITPVKSGDYGGRLVFIRKDDWAIALNAVFWGNGCQLLWLMVCGLLGLLYLSTVLSENLLQAKTSLVVVLIVVMLMLIIVWFYLRIILVRKLIFYLPFKEKLRKVYYNFLKIKNRNDLYKTLIIAGLRYFTYIIQSMLLISVFNNTIAFSLLLSGVMTVFFVQAILPVLSFLGLIGRTGIAIFVLNKIGVSEMDGGVSSIMLWVVNIFIPSMVGLYFLFRKMINKQNEKKELDIS